MTEPSTLQSLLNRPPTERLREYKYRFAQCTIFGLPVFALYFLGPHLGGADSARWTGLLQTLLAGWCLYIGAVPMLVEGLLLITQGKPKPDLLVATLAAILYILGLIGWILTLAARRAIFPSAFSCAVLLLILWSQIQWWRFSRQLHTSPSIDKMADTERVSP